jgi:DNA topoisomerase-1
METLRNRSTLHRLNRRLMKAPGTNRAVTATADFTEPRSLQRDPFGSAESAGLRYFSDARPGLGRRRAGKGFYYVGVDKQVVRDVSQLRRIRALAIPPAWTEVWICPFANGHLQATGRDSKGRKQYRYHSKWRETRDQVKYHRMVAFGKSLPKLRRVVRKHLRLPGLCREKVLATVARLLETTLIRVGNEEYAQTNKSFGLTTLRGRHVRIKGSTLNFQFRGKSGKVHSVSVDDKRLADIVKGCMDIPGYELFQFLDESGQPQAVDSADVNAYLKEITGDEFTAKDFRTWAGTTLAAVALCQSGGFTLQSEAKRNILQAVQSVAEQLGNTPAVCRNCYINPAVVDAYMNGITIDTVGRNAKVEEMRQAGLRSEEAAVIALLEELQEEPLKEAS